LTQAATAVLLVVTAVAMIALRNSIVDLMTDELRRDPTFTQADIDVVNSVISVVFIVIAVVYVLFAATYGVLAFGNMRGWQATRIISWVFAGIGLACCGLPGLFTQGDYRYQFGDTGTELDAEMEELLEEILPSWLGALDIATAAVFVVGSILIIVLLALPKSGAFFRKTPPAPPMYPGQPYYGPQGPQGPQPPYGQTGPQGPQQPPYGQPPYSGQ
jgi:hypothetical protein